MRKLVCTETFRNKPKIKIYACTRAETNEKSVHKLAALKETVLAELKNIIDRNTQECIKNEINLFKENS